MKLNIGIISCLLLMVSEGLFAQETIIKKDKSEIKAKVLEITSDVIKYKKWEKPEGPTYNVEAREVFMIIYSDGEKEYFDTQSSNTQMSDENMVNINQKSNETFNDKKYLNLFFDLDGFPKVEQFVDFRSGETETVTLFNFGLSYIVPLRLNGTEKLMYGGQLTTYGLPNQGVTLFWSAVVGYNHSVSKQLSFLGSLKPTFAYSSVFTGVDNSGIEVYEDVFDFVFLLGAKTRYFFSETGKFGLTGELIISTQSGSGATFALGAVMRFNSNR